MLQSTLTQQQGGSILQLNCPKWILTSLFWRHLLLCLALLVLSSAFFCLKAFWSSNCYVWNLDSVLGVDPSQLEGFYIFFHCWQVGDCRPGRSLCQRQQWHPTSCIKPFKSSPLFCVQQHPTSEVAAAPPRAIEQPPHSSLRVGSELTAKKGSLLLWMSKTCSLTETDLKLTQRVQINLRLMNSTVISYVNSFMEFSHDSQYSS